MRNKKAQTPEFIGIVILVIVIAAFALFTKVNSSLTAVSKSEEVIREYETLRFLLISKVFPYVTINNIPIEQLLGVYVCYQNDTVDYGFGATNITRGVRDTLDYAAGEDKWALQIGETLCITSKTVEHEECMIPSNKKYHASEFIVGLQCFVRTEKGILFVEHY